MIYFLILGGEVLFFWLLCEGPTIWARIQRALCKRPSPKDKSNG